MADQQKPVLYCVVRRKRMFKNDRKVAVFRYVVVATSDEHAIETVRAEYTHADQLDTWSAYAAEDGAVELGCYHDDPTPQEKKDRAK